MSNEKKPADFRVSVNEYDQRTTADLKNARFSGIRANDLMNQFEIWILGQVDRTVTYAQFWQDEQSLTTAYCIAFGLKDAILTGAVDEAVREMKGRKAGIEKLEATPEGRKLLDSTNEPTRH